MNTPHVLLDLLEHGSNSNWRDIHPYERNKLCFVCVVSDGGWGYKISKISLGIFLVPPVYNEKACPAHQTEPFLGWHSWVEKDSRSKKAKAQHINSCWKLKY